MSMQDSEYADIGSITISVKDLVSTSTSQSDSNAKHHSHQAKAPPEASNSAICGSNA